MDPSSIFFAIKPVGKIGSITIDAVLSEKPVRVSNITSHPVETGEPVSDHTYDENY